VRWPGRMRDLPEWQADGGPGSVVAVRLLR
jgi:hypothetical protein